MTSKDIKNVGIACSLQMAIAAPAANAQVEVLTTNPIVGGSTLEQVKPVRKDSVELQFPSGFTCSVSGGDGPSLSFYSDATLAVRLRTREETVVAARDDLVLHDLVAYQAPLTQVLSLPKPRVERGYAAAVRELMNTQVDTASPNSKRKPS